MTEERKPSVRIAAIDALRGIAVVLMVVHHFLFDLVTFLGAPEALFSNPVFDILHYFFAGLFIFLSGISSRFSRSNLRRGARLFLIALALTGVTYLISMPIKFGILHLLSVCMLLYGAAAPVIDRLRGIAAPLLYTVLTAASAYATAVLNPVSCPFLFPLGFYAPGFYSADYFPILPWVFVFLCGTWMGQLVTAHKLPAAFYRWNPPFFPAVGRVSLYVYLAHQPVLYGLVWLLGKLTGG